jgi:DnaJ-class molecular chaperone
MTHPEEPMKEEEIDVKCLECNGSGVFDRIDVWAIPCDVCDGSGVVKIPASMKAEWETSFPKALEASKGDE